MALDGTYAALLGAVSDWSNKDDPESRIADFVSLAEDRLNPILRQTTLLTGVPFRLTTDAPTNDLLTNYPNLYLFAALLESATYWADDAAAAKWQARMMDALATVKANVGKAKARGMLKSDLALTRSSYYEFWGFDPGESPDVAPGVVPAPVTVPDPAAQFKAIAGD